MFASCNTARCRKKSLLVPVVLCLLLNVAAYANGAATADNQAVLDLQTLNVRGMNVGELAAFLSYSGSLRVVASQKAAQTTVSIFLQEINARDALEAICRSAGLVYRPSGNSGVAFILTQQEFSASRGLYNDEVVESIQLRHATAADVGETLRNLFADRLVWIAPSDDMGNAEYQIDRALGRMDLLTEYEEFTRGDSDSDSDSSNNRRSSDRRDSDSSRSRTSSSTRRRGGDSSSMVDFAMLDRYRALLDDRQAGLASPGAAAVVAEDARFGVVFVSAFPATNMILLRSTDSRALEQIKAAVEDLDKPTPQVLLEVKVLELDLGDGKHMGVDWLWQGGDVYAGSSNWTRGKISELPEESGTGGLELPISNYLSGATGFNPRTAVVGVISDHLMARMRLMESQGRLTQLATPTLLVADDEASRVFIGSQSQFLKKVERSSVVISEGGQTSGGDLTPELEERSIGMNLLITPRIHADRSVTLRVLQEDTGFGDMRSINFGGEAAVEVQDIRHRSVVSTIVAHDKHWVIIGGLLREGIAEKESGVPILKDIPWLGNLFKSTGTTRIRSELVVMIRPLVLVAPGDDVNASRELLERVSRHSSVQHVFDNVRVDLKPLSPDDKKEVEAEAGSAAPGGGEETP
jgi:general secretion pathway protein D